MRRHFRNGGVESRAQRLEQAHELRDLAGQQSRAGRDEREAVGDQPVPVPRRLLQQRDAEQRGQLLVEQRDEARHEAVAQQLVRVREQELPASARAVVSVCGLRGRRSVLAREPLAQQLLDEQQAELDLGDEHVARCGRDGVGDGSGRELVGVLEPLALARVAGHEPGREAECLAGAHLVAELADLLLDERRHVHALARHLDAVALQRRALSGAGRRQQPRGPQRGRRGQQRRRHLRRRVGIGVQRAARERQKVLVQLAEVQRRLLGELHVGRVGVAHLARSLARSIRSIDRSAASSGRLLDRWWPLPVPKMEGNAPLQISHFGGLERCARQRTRSKRAQETRKVTGFMRVCIIVAILHSEIKFG